MVIGYLLAGVGVPAVTFAALWAWRRFGASAGPGRPHRRRMPGTGDLSSLSDASELAGSLVLMQATLTELGDRIATLDRQRDQLDQQLAQQVLAALRLAEQASRFDLRFTTVPDGDGGDGGGPAT
jgi:hypothetical protein